MVAWIRFHWTNGDYFEKNACFRTVGCSGNKWTISGLKLRMCVVRVLEGSINACGRLEATGETVGKVGGWIH